MIYKIGDKLKCKKYIHYEDRDSIQIDETFIIDSYEYGFDHKLNYYLLNYYLRETTNSKNPIVRGYKLRVVEKDMANFECVRVDRINKINKINGM
jgi:hypothetical protein